MRGRSKRRSRMSTRHARRKLWLNEWGGHGLFFFSSRGRHTRCSRDWSSDVCSSDLLEQEYELVLEPEPLVPAYDQRPAETPIAPPQPEPVAQNAGPAPPAGSGFASDQLDRKSVV